MPLKWERCSTRKRAIITYENLGIGRLIYQLPTTLCEIFLSEVFKKNSIDSSGSGDALYHQQIL